MITYLYNLILTVYCIFNRDAYQMMHSPTRINNVAKIANQFYRIHSKFYINDKIYSINIQILKNLFRAITDSLSNLINHGNENLKMRMYSNLRDIWNPGIQGKKIRVLELHQENSNIYQGSKTRKKFSHHVDLFENSQRCPKKRYDLHIDY